MRTVDDLCKVGVAGRRILVRCDLNVPLSSAEPPRVTDDGRIRASLPGLLPHYLGPLVREELQVLRRLTGEAGEVRRPYVVVLGGSKVSDKLGVISSLLPKVDQLLVGGGMCFTFLKAQGHEVGDSLLESDQVDNCRRFLADAGNKIVLPIDVVVSAEFSADAQTATVAATGIPTGKKGLDIGPETVATFASAL